MWLIIALLFNGNNALLILLQTGPILVPLPAANMQIFMFSNEDVNEFVNFPLDLLFNIICAKI